MISDRIYSILNVAGEITDKYKAKIVTIVSSSDKLICPDLDDKFYSGIKSLIEDAGVKVNLPPF